MCLLVLSPGCTTPLRRASAAWHTGYPPVPSPQAQTQVVELRMDEELPKRKKIESPTMLPME